MPRVINGVRYFNASETAAAVGCSRTTLWRWSKAGAIPRAAIIFRDVERLFTEGQIQMIREHANRMIFKEGQEPAQLDLFSRMRGEKS